MKRKYLLKEFLVRIKRPIKINPDIEYKLVTISSKHRGVKLRHTKRGEHIKSNMYEVKAGDFILSGIDARNGAFGIVPRELDGAIITNDFWCLKINEDVILKELFLELTATSWFDEICNRGSDGTTNRIRLQKDKFFNQTVILPLKEKQHSLLNKILKIKSNTLILINEIETQKQLLSQLKQAILQEAIEGKLTKEWREQNPNIEPASELLKRIKAEKKQLVKEKKIKKEKSLSPISADEIPFEIPETWVWCILDNIALFKNGKAHEQFVNADGEYVLINSKFVSTNGEKIKYTGNQMMPMFVDEIAIVMSDVPNGRALSRCFIIDENDKYSLNQRIGGIVSINGIYPKYLLYLLDRNKYYLSFNDGKKQTNLKKSQIMTCPIPLPPLEEQKAIVEKVESLMEKCNALEQEISKSEAYANMLMQAVLKEAFEEQRDIH